MHNYKITKTTADENIVIETDDRDFAEMFLQPGGFSVPADASLSEALKHRDDIIAGVVNGLEPLGKSDDCQRRVMMNPLMMKELQKRTEGVKEQVYGARVRYDGA